MFHDYNQLAGLLAILLVIVIAFIILLFFAIRFLSGSKTNRKFEKSLPKIIEK